MTLNTIQNFAKTRDAAAFSSAIEARVEMGKLAVPSVFVAHQGAHQQQKATVAA